MLSQPTQAEILLALLASEERIGPSDIETAETDKLIMNAVIRDQSLAKARNSHGMLLAHMAARLDRIELLHVLLALGSPRSGYCKAGITLVGHACQTSKGPALLRLLSAEAFGPNSELQMRASQKPVAPLTQCAIEENLPGAEALLAAGADPNHLDRYGHSAARAAIESPCRRLQTHQAIMEALFQAGANFLAPDQEGKTDWSIIRINPERYSSLIAKVQTRHEAAELSAHVSSRSASAPLPRI